MPVGVSLELEKARPGDVDVEALLPAADVVFLSREYARGVRHLASPAAVMDEFDCLVPPHALLVVPWGSAGAYASVPGAGGRLRLFAPAHMPGTPLHQVPAVVAPAVAGAVAARAGSEGTPFLSLRRVQLSHCNSTEGGTTSGPAPEPPAAGRIADTIGAGDTFHATFIAFLTLAREWERAAGPGAGALVARWLRGDGDATAAANATAGPSLPKLAAGALAFACFVAGEKCGIVGFDLAPAQPALVAAARELLTAALSGCGEGE
jgi:sugar/nucleoside kinase (ribokinase family)